MNVPSFELIGARTGNCQRVAIALAETGLSFRVRRIDLERGDQRSLAHVALNPAGKVPVLRVRESGGELVLSQSNAILLYLAGQAPGVLLPLQPAAHALALERFFYFVTDVIAVSHAGFSLRSGHMRQNASATAALEERALAGVTFAAQFVATAPFMGGAQFSLADICAWTIVQSLRRHLDWAATPALAQWFDRVGARSSIRRGMQAFDRPLAQA